MIWTVFTVTAAEPKRKTDLFFLGSVIFFGIFFSGKAIDVALEKRDFASAGKTPSYLEQVPAKGFFSSGESPVSSVPIQSEILKGKARNLNPDDIQSRIKEKRLSDKEALFYQKPGNELCEAESKNAGDRI